MKVQTVVVDALFWRNTLATDAVAAVWTAIQPATGSKDTLPLHTGMPALVAGSATPPTSVVPADDSITPGSAARISMTHLSGQTGTILGAQFASFVGVAHGVTTPGDVVAKARHAHVVLRADAAGPSTAVSAALQPIAGREPTFEIHTALTTSACAVSGTYTAVLAGITVAVSTPGNVDAHRCALRVGLEIPVHPPASHGSCREYPLTGEVIGTDAATGTTAVISALPMVAGHIETHSRAANMAARTGAVIGTGQTVLPGTTGSVSTPRNVRAQPLGTLEMVRARPALSPAAIVATIPGFACDELALPPPTVLSASLAGAAASPASIIATLRALTGGEGTQPIHAFLPTCLTRAILRAVAAVLIGIQVAGTVSTPGLVQALAAGALVMLRANAAGSRTAVPATFNSVAVRLAPVEALVPFRLALVICSGLDTVVRRALGAVFVHAELQTIPLSDGIGSCPQHAVLRADVILAALHAVHDLPAESRAGPDTLTVPRARLADGTFSAEPATQTGSALPPLTRTSAVIRAQA